MRGLMPFQRIQRRVYLYELLWALCEVTSDDSEVVATALHMIREGKVSFAPQREALA